MAFRLLKTCQAFENEVSFHKSQLLYLDLNLLRFFGWWDLVGGCEVTEASFGTDLESESAHILALRQHGRILAFDYIVVLEYAFSNQIAVFEEADELATAQSWVV